MNNRTHPLPIRKGIAALLPLALLAITILTPRADAQTYALSNSFTLANTVGDLSSGTGNRGAAYDSVSNLVYVANSSTTALEAYDGAAGTVVGAFNMTGVSGGTTFSLDQVAVANDGAIYGINLCTAATSNNKIYRWANWQAVATTAVNTNVLTNGASISLTSGRVGDTLVATGSGINTVLLAGVGAKTAFVLFSTTDGVNFTPTIVNVPTGLTLAANVYGLTFYTNNTFLVKPASSSSSTVFLIQYPANFASQTLVTGTVIASATLGTSFNNTTFIAYSPTNGGVLAAVTPGTTTQIGFLSATNITTGTTLLASTNVSTPTSNGNATGGVGLAGTNALYAYATANSLFGYRILTTPPQPPTISSQPVGGTVYPPYTLSVTVTGTSPFSYQWQATNTAVVGAFTNVPSATNSSLTISAVGTNLFRVIVTNTVGSVTSSVVSVTILPATTSAVVTNLWKVPAGSNGYPYLSISDGESRGIAFDTNTSQVVVASGTGGSGLHILNALTGANVGILPLGSATFTGVLGYVDQVKIADDGAVYAANLVLGAGGGYKLYRWTSVSTNASNVLAFSDSGGVGGTFAGFFLTSDRWGDTMAIRGSGTATQILLGSRSSGAGSVATNVALLTTTDGTNFIPSVISITNASAEFSGGGVTFGAGNTFWANATSGGRIVQVSFDPVGLTGGVVFTYASPASLPSGLDGVAVDAVNNILAGVNLNDVNNDAQLFQLTGTVDAPVLFDQAFFPSANGNGNGTVALAMKSPYLFALDANNGVIAMTYGVPPSSPPLITTQPASATVYSAIPSVSFSVSVSGSVPIFYQWQYGATSNSFTNILNATNSSYTLSFPSASQAGFYQVVVHNIAGAVTSTPPAKLTILSPVTNAAVTNLWQVPANSAAALPFLDGSSASFNTRGMAYDPTTTNLLVADHSSIYVLSTAGGISSVTNGVAFTMNTSGFPTTGINGWTVDQIAVADDGTLYSANLTGDGTGFFIAQWPNVSSGAGPAPVFQADTLSTLSPNDRYGDTMAIRGSGVNTQILFGSLAGSNVVLFTTTDGSSFTPQVITVSDPTVTAGYAGGGIAFGAGNTFWAKGGHNYNLRQVAFTPGSTNGTVVQNYLATISGGTIPNDLTGLSVDVSNNIIAGVGFNDTPNDLQLYKLTGTTNSPVLFDQTFFGSVNPNSQEDAVTTLKGGLGFALDVNNGLVAIQYGVPLLPFTVTATKVPGTGLVLSWPSQTGHSYAVRQKTSLLNAWSTNTFVPGTGGTMSFTNSTLSGTSLFYSVVAQ